ncbi:transaldolase [Flagellimonas sp. CMM7]|uniref:transaldolase n=1 Tax=Flagellimonas sp. CMM7 TaxID=2654676 RepID=UPI0013CF40D4|nr:transaldolase [Flagellimonas sp. CMM7]UII80300.1 transaldolase [Flagellimonas sp. CMM7]
MNANTKKLYDQGVSIWLDNITRKMIDDGTLKKYIEELKITGLTSNPSIFEAAIAKTNYYDDAIAKINTSGLSDEELFFSLAIEDIQRAADAFLPVFKATNGLDGFVSIEVSPLLAYDAESTLKASKTIHGQVNRPNVFIKIPGTPEGLPAIEQSIAAGIPINITLLFSAEQYEAAAMAYLKGIEDRIKNGLNPDVRSVASVFVSRWDRAVADKVPDNLKNKLGIAVMYKTYHAYQKFLASNRVRRAVNYGASPQRVLWASTGTKDPNASDVLYVKSLIAPFTVNTIPEKTLLAYADHGELDKPMVDNTEAADSTLDQFNELSIDYLQLAQQLQKEGAESFNASWDNLIKSIASKRKLIKI